MTSHNTRLNIDNSLDTSNMFDKFDQLVQKVHYLHANTSYGQKPNANFKDGDNLNTLEHHDTKRKIVTDLIFMDLQEKLKI